MGEKRAPRKCKQKNRNDYLTISHDGRAVTNKPAAGRPDVWALTKETTLDEVGNSHEVRGGDDTDPGNYCLGKCPQSRLPREWNEGDLLRKEWLRRTSVAMKVQTEMKKQHIIAG